MALPKRCMRSIGRAQRMETAIVTSTFCNSVLPDERHGETCGRSCTVQLLRIGAGHFTVAAAEGVGIAFQRLTLGRDRSLSFAQAAGPGTASETSHDSWLLLSRACVELRWDLVPVPVPVPVPAPARLHQADCPAASRISCVISSGWEISERWLAFTSIVLAPIRFAMKRSRSGLIVRSSVETG
jgi:hypothetical protein